MKTARIAFWLLLMAGASAGLAAALVGAMADRDVARAGTEGDEAMADVVDARGQKNRLAGESSPYLLQHADNPVGWYPWGGEAFARAKAEDKPVFLSIGYSTCHWCHVMEHESFENERIAEILNEHFVCIKVDREQRPDVDETYMRAVQLMTGSGGWPLSVFLTPDGKPFYGGTYFPPTRRFGRPGFDEVLLAIAKAWKDERGQVLESAGKLTAALLAGDEQGQAQELSAAILDQAYSGLAGIFDERYGGFGRAPKFPQPTVLSMLLNYWSRTGQKKPLEMVEQTLDRMAKGGMYDQLGGGFHRYSTDEKWLVPHFEKMLYDQALLSRAYVEAFQATGKKEYAAVARDIFEYVLRDMTDSRGGFYAAENADSEGKEGVFYVWEPKQLEDVLGAEKAKIVGEYYGVTKDGNFEEGKSILHVATSVEELARRHKTSAAQMEDVLEEARGRLLERRGKRIRPSRDDKVITAWNGLMISSMACGGAALGESRYVDAAGRAGRFALRQLQVDGRLMRYWRDGKAVERGFLDDYAFMALGLLDLYEATFDAKYLAESKRLTDEMAELFEDAEHGGFFLTGRDGERLIRRGKPSYDGAVPSGNSVATTVLLRLGRLTSDEELAEQAEKALHDFSDELARAPTSLTAMLGAFSFLLGPSQEIVIASKSGDGQVERMLRSVRGRFLPNAVVVLRTDGQDGRDIGKLIPFVKGYVPIDGRATAYVCENYACRQPVNSIEKLDRILDEIARARGK